MLSKDKVNTFKIVVIPYTGDDAWVETALIDAKRCLMQDAVPVPAPDCDYCRYVAAVHESLQGKI